MKSWQVLKEKAQWVRRETLKLHKRAPGTRLASSLSDIEILVVLFYGGILDCDPQDLHAEDRDRLIVSKGHGAISLYPILADLDFFAKAELYKIGQKDSFLRIIPDAAVPGFETVNGSVGHGLGVACGIAIGLKRKGVKQKVFVLCGDGELNEGANWEAIVFAAHHELDNLIVVVDNNRMSMLGYQKEILDIEPMGEKFAVLGWETKTVDGHDLEQLYTALCGLKERCQKKPAILIANTVKGKGVPLLERDPLCHVKSLKPDEVDRVLASGL
jgi:transketolase